MEFGHIKWYYITNSRFFLTQKESQSVAWRRGQGESICAGPLMA